MRAGVGIVVLSWLLAGCSARDDRAPFAESRTPPELAERFYPPEGWTWGFLRVGDAPVQRYGVAGSARPVRADILILPDYGETAETWFETIRDLTGHGYRVWVLEAIGQGGSGRLGGRRDVGDARDFQPDVAGVRAMVQTVIRPTPGTPLFVIAQGAGAVIAVPAVAEGLAVSGLVLSAPRLDVERGGPPPVLGDWKADMKGAFAAHAIDDRWRGDVTLAWQRANPDLRMGAPDPRWLRGYAKAMIAARAAMKRLPTPMLVIEGDRGASQALELGKDPARAAWLRQIDAFSSRTAAYSLGPTTTH